MITVKVTLELLDDWEVFYALLCSRLADALRELLESEDKLQEQKILYGDGTEPPAGFQSIKRE